MSIYTTALILGLAYSSLALGIYISMRIFNIPDITTDGSFTLGGAVTATLTLAGVSPALSLPLAFGAGAIAGMATGWIHTRLRVNALLAGILVASALYSINLIIMGRSNLPLINLPSIFTIFHLPVSESLNQIFILILFTSVLLFLLHHLLRSDFGLAMRATGNNENMIRSLGVNTDRMKITGLALANGLVALSGYLITAVEGYADINMGIGVIMLGLGSVMIGEMTGRIKASGSTGLKLMSVIGGSIVFRMILGLALAAGIDPVFLKILVALFVLAVVAVPQINYKR